jgi:hypothetical protein
VDKKRVARGPRVLDYSGSEKTNGPDLLETRSNGPESQNAVRPPMGGIIYNVRLVIPLVYYVTKSLVSSNLVSFCFAMVIRMLVPSPSLLFFIHSVYIGVTKLYCNEDQLLDLSNCTSKF